MSSVCAVKNATSFLGCTSFAVGYELGKPKHYAVKMSYCVYDELLKPNCG